jgi:Zn-dependent protease with chaperone function
MQGIFGVDIYRVFGARWMVVNVAFGIVLTPLVVWWARRFDARQDGIAKGLADDIAGRRLSDAMRRLDEIGAFESEV